MNKILVLSIGFLALAGCGAATAPGTLHEGGVKRVTVIEKFARLDLLAGFEPGPVENTAVNGLSSGDMALMKAALTSGLEREGLLAAKNRPQIALLSLDVIDVGPRRNGVAVTVRMTVQNRHNLLVLGRADVVGHGPRGDVRSAALSAVDTIIKLVAGKMKKPA